MISGAQLAEILGVEESSVRRMHRNGIVKGCPIAGGMLFPTDAIFDLVESRLCTLKSSGEQARDNSSSDGEPTMDGVKSLRVSVKANGTVRKQKG